MHSPEYSAREQRRELNHVSMSVFNAIANGNEQRYRELVLLPAGDHYSDALTATMFEAVRLHQAVDNMPGAVARRRAVTAPERIPQLPLPDYRDNARAMLNAAAGWTFTVSGDRATINELSLSPSSPSLRRTRGRWMLVPTPWDTPRETATYRLMVQSERRLAEALGAARAAVADGSAKSVEDVNAI
ncbi:MAG: hypothetical protein M3478_03245, partial [Planctomycetota bacterium]|nr:hypothetical protein [Planctomycetota bacterium]